MKKLKEWPKNKKIVAITASMKDGTGLKEFAQKFPDRFFDVGIAEQHAVAYASGIATNGGKPVLSISSSFIQRAYDQLSQDLALNNNPATLLIFWGGISNADATHLCTFDIPLISNIPNIVYIAPTCKEEYVRMLDWSVNQNEHSVAIRVPFSISYSGVEDNTDYSVLNKYQMVEKGEKIAIVALGSFFDKGKKVKALLKEKLGIDATLINPKFITGVDKDMLESLKSNHSVVITLEDGELDGGFGEKITRFYGDSSMKVLNYGSLKEFTDRTPMEELETRYRLKPELIVEDIQYIL
jgi:1-deoxy-D-xylulose-5-phosphate synthase